MSDFEAFDRHAASYGEAVDAAIRASGENTEFFARLKVHLVRQNLRRWEPSTILDFGCGIGISSRALLAEFSSSTVTGCDGSYESINVASERSESDRLTFIAHDRSGLPFGDSTFDVGFASCVFHHIDPPDRIRWFRELRRVLVPGAPLFIFEHNPYNPLTVRVVRRIPFDEGVKLLRPYGAAELLRAAQFRVGRPRFYFFFPRILRCLRPIEAYLDWMPLGAQYYVVGWRE